MDKWLNIGCNCDYCGRELETRPAAVRHGFVIKGYEPMDYRHVHNGEKHCYTQHSARPYSDARIYELYCQIRRQTEKDRPG